MLGEMGSIVEQAACDARHLRTEPRKEKKEAGLLGETELASGVHLPSFFDLSTIACSCLGNESMAKTLHGCAERTF